VRNSLFLKSAGKEEYSVITALGGLAVVLIWVIYRIGDAV
jgi:hypothetical protein